MAFAKRVKELESEREKKFLKVTKPGQHILDLNLEAGEAESEMPTEKGTQIDSKYLSTLLRPLYALQLEQ